MSPSDASSSSHRLKPLPHLAFRALILGAGVLLNPKSGRRYPIRDVIPIFFEELSGSNKKYQQLYDRIALFYDAAEAGRTLQRGRGGGAGIKKLVTLAPVLQQHSPA